MYIDFPIKFNNNALFLGFLSTVLLLNCSSLDKKLSPINKLEIETLVAVPLMNIRAQELTQKNVVVV